MSGKAKERKNPIPELDEVEEHLRAALDALKRARGVYVGYDESPDGKHLDTLDCIDILGPTLIMALDYAGIFKWQDSLRESAGLKRWHWDVQHAGWLDYPI
jgi:hypothetical protein